MLSGRQCLAGLVWAIVAIALPAAAAAAVPEWLAPPDISSTSDDAAEPHVAFDALGNATAVWGRPTTSFT